MNAWKQNSLVLGKGFLNSYSQLFFSGNGWFALLLIFVSFFIPWAGISGAFAVGVSNGCAYLIGLNKQNIRSGYYGFNSLLVALGLGLYYNPNPEFFLLLFFASLLTLLLTVMFEGITGKYGLPYLSIPFVLGISFLMLASRQFTALEISERGIYTLNEVYSWGGLSLLELYEKLNNLNLHESLVLYFKSLGAILFQYNIIAGILIAIGLLCVSRISFLLSLVGFFSAFFYYKIIGANISELSYNFIGFNYILTAIALGGFFIVPSKSSFLWVLLLTPLISILITSMQVVFSVLQLSVLSLPFNMMVLMFLYVLKFRDRHLSFPELVVTQQGSPEKNLYFQDNLKKRFLKSKPFHLSLPFYGQWKVSQGNNGVQTHKGEWKHAWDFVVVNPQGSTFKSPGGNITDYFCYNKPVLSPADGVVEDIVDNIPDNEIGDVNLTQNWGNTIVIKHAQFLYSKISHLKPGSFKVKKGDYVRKGDVIAHCGSSGRSPEPHVHLQFQAEPYIDSKTIDYPISSFITNVAEGYQLNSFDTPRQDEKVSNIEKNVTLGKAFHFTPGQKLRFTEEGIQDILEWEVHTDIYNNSYLWCTKTRSAAYFSNYGDTHYFTSFHGDKKSMLYYFFLGSYKVILGFYKDIELNDSFSLILSRRKPLILLQDLLAPFFIFMKSDFKMKYDSREEYLGESTIQTTSSYELKAAGIQLQKHTFEMCVAHNRIERFTVKAKGITRTIHEIEDNA